MITRDYCLCMARYTAWQTQQLLPRLAGLTPAEAEADRGAHFGSIRRTLAHLLWGDMIWMSRFDGGPGPVVNLASSPDHVPTLQVWVPARQAMDARILTWAQGVQDAKLQGDLTWWSGAAGREVTKPLALCVVHFFNHQTHHRGQVHAMLTAAGQDGPVSDLFLMPDF